MALHGGQARPAHRRADGLGGGGDDEGYAAWSEKQGLGVRLRSTARLEPIPGQLLRKYIAYARQYVHPRLSEDAHGALQDFYISLRKKQRGGDSVPVTTRQLESLIRLAEARARMELREVVTRQDALDAVEVVKETIIFDTLADLVGSTGLGAVAAAARSAPRGSQSASKVAQSFVSKLEAEANDKGDPVFTTQELKDSFSGLGIPCPRPTFRDFLDELNVRNYILNSGGGKWKLQCSGLRATQGARH